MKWSNVYPELSSKRFIVHLAVFLLFIFSFPSFLNAQICEGSIELTSQTAIDNFDCTEVGSNLTIREAVEGNITNLDGLSELSYVHGSLVIANNAKLTNLDGLASLSKIYEELIISGNDKLENIDGLQSLRGVGLLDEKCFPECYYDLDISDNVALNRCCGLYPLLTYKDAKIIANQIIYGNNAGCNSTEEIRNNGPCEFGNLITIQAEDYDEGGQHISYYDTTPGNAGGQYRQDDVDIWWYYPDKYYIGSNSTGEWLNYTIDVPISGKYQLAIGLATPNDNRRLHVEFDGVDETGSLTVPNTGWWTTWQTLYTEVSLDAGRQVMRFVIDYGGLNIDQISLMYIDRDMVATPTIYPNGGTFVGSVDVAVSSITDLSTIYYTTDGSDPVTSGTSIEYIGPFTLTEDAIVRAYAKKDGLINSDIATANFTIQEAPVMTIQAEDYDEGGQHISYYDTTPGNAGGQYRQDDVDIWWYGPDTYYTGANATGEWLNYTIDVPHDGDYRLEIRAATPNDNRRLHVEFDGVNKTGSLTVPNTGAWTKWGTLSTNVSLNAGRQVMNLVIDMGGLNIDKISLKYVESMEVGLIAFYPFNGDANDESGNGNDGVAFGAILTENRFGKTDSAFRFDGIDDYIRINETNHPQGEVSITYAAWVYLNEDWRHVGTVIDVGDGRSWTVQNKRSCMLILPNQGMRYVGEQNDVVPDSAFVPLDEWTFIAVTKSARNVKFYINGELKYQGTSEAGQNVTNQRMNIGLTLPNEYVPLSEAFNGLIDDVYIYSRALSETEIKALYNRSN